MVIFNDLAHAGAAPVLEQVLRFAGARQRLLAHNIANVDTPDFRPVDVSPSAFREELARAVRARREARAGNAGALPLGDTDEVSFARGLSGSLTLRPSSPSRNVLYHDRNNRDLERLMQSVAENQLMYRTAADLLRRENDLLRTAIGQRV